MRRRGLLVTISMVLLLSSGPLGVSLISPLQTPEFYVGDPVSSDGPLAPGQALNDVRSAEPLPSFFDIEYLPRPLVGFGGQDTNVTVSVGALHDVGGRFDGVSWRFASLRDEPLGIGSGSCALDLRVEGMDRAETSVLVPFTRDMYVRAMANGWDTLRMTVALQGTDDLGKDLRSVAKVEFHVGQRVAMLVDGSLYPLIKDKMDRYEQDVASTMGMEFIHETGSWTTPEQVRVSLIDLWKDEGITGAMLWGYLPYAMWELVHQDGKVETCPVPVFYEDLDGTFSDVDGDGYYDRHGWGANDGPEIWVSLMMPPRTTIPSSHLDPFGTGCAGGLLGKYYDDRWMNTLSFTRVDPFIEFYWTEDCPDNLEPDHFSVVWTGRLKADESGTYTLAVNAGGGVRVRIDGRTVFDRPDHCTWNMTEFLFDVHMTKGWHDLKIEHWENGWGVNTTGGLRLMWSSPSVLAGSLNDYLDRSHTYHTEGLDVPKRALHYMDYCYGVKHRMHAPTHNKHLKPLYGDNIVDGGCHNQTSGTEYIGYLKDPYELISVWAHAGSSNHWISSPDMPEDEMGGANSWQIRRSEASVATLIWGCHAGDYGNKGSGTSKVSENLVATYAFGTPHGLAAAGCTRSFGTTFDNIYWGWQNGSAISTGFFAYIDRVYNETLRTGQYPYAGPDRWIDDVVLFGDPFLVVGERPTMLAVQIDGGGGHTVEREVALTVSAKCAQEVRFRNAGGEWSPWMPFCTTHIWTLPEGLGAIRVTMQARNDLGLGWSTASDVITRISTMADHVSIEINEGEELTNLTQVRLAMLAENARTEGLLMSLSEDGKGWTDWESFTATRTWRFDAGDGERSVHLRVRSTDGLWKAGATDSILLDTRPPVTTPVLMGDLGGSSWYVSLVVIDLEAEDVTTGVATSVYSLDGGTTWEDPAGAISFEEDGEHTVLYRSLDDAGNWEGPGSVTFKMDTQAPHGLSVTMADGSRPTNVPMVELDLTADDRTSGLDAMRFKVGDQDWGSWMNYAPTHLVTLPSGAEEVEVLFTVRDMAGNEPPDPARTVVHFDAASPRLAWTEPVPGATGVALDAQMTLVFSEAVDADTITSGSILVQEEDGRVLMGNLVHDEGSMTVTFEPEATLTPWTEYSILVMATITDLAGNVLEDGQTQMWSFRTAGTAPGAPMDPTVVEEMGVTLRWSRPDDEGSPALHSFNVYRMAGDGTDVGNRVLLGSTADLSFVDIQAVEGVTYHYWVTAVSVVGEGEPSPVASILLVPEVEPDDGADLPLEHDPSGGSGPEETSSTTDGPSQSVGGTYLAVIIAVAIIAGASAVLHVKGHRWGPRS